MDKLREVVRDGAEAYVRMVESGEGYGALTDSDRAAIDRYEDLFDLSDDGAPPAIIALLDVAEAAALTVDALDRASEPGEEQDWTRPMVDLPLRAALDHLREVTQ